MYFDELPLDDRLLDALYEMRIEQCTPIQEQAIPPLLEGRDLVGIAQTGTGKTATYLLPILNRLCSGDYPEGSVNCVIMVPTRELAMQIDQALEAFSYYLPFSGVAVYGGNDGIRYEQELRGMKRGADIIVATPGRLISHLQLGNVDLSKVSFFVLDEADRMLDMGFHDDIMKIAAHLPTNRHTLLFSATMPAGIRQLANSLLHDPVEVRIAVSKPAEGIDHKAYICYEPQKMKILEHIFAEFSGSDTKRSSGLRAIMFVGKKQRVKDLALRLRKLGLSLAAMHSDLTQEERNHVMLDFKAGRISLIVATDIISRGIDIDDIQLVVNYDVPHEPEDYIHRIGRTARAGKEGRALTLVGEADQYYFGKIEQVIGKEIPKLPLPEGLTEVPEYNPFGAKSKRNNKFKNYGRKRPSRHRNGRRKSDTNKTDASANNSRRSTQRRRNDRKPTTNNNA
ncbi:MAG: DEAD/DEAH box helicase [Prevotellaceae bacterium]|nr:DEAD/DEAH box helicase [Prevotellaceae bacterium]